MKNTTRKNTAAVKAPQKKEAAQKLSSKQTARAKAAIASAKKNGAAEVQTLAGTINLVKPASVEPELENPQGLTLVDATGEVIAKVKPAAVETITKAIEDHSTEGRRAQIAAIDAGDLAKRRAAKTAKTTKKAFAETMNDVAKKLMEQAKKNEANDVRKMTSDVIGAALVPGAKSLTARQQAKLDEAKAKLAAAVDPNPQPAPDPKAKRLSPKEKREAIARGESTRVTPGAVIDTWRLRRSQRVGVSGWFVQGGHSVKSAKGERFTVGKEAFFSNLDDAKKYYGEVAPKVSV